MRAVPEYVACEMRRYPSGVPGPYEDRPSPWMTDEDLHAEGIAPEDDFAEVLDT